MIEKFWVSKSIQENLQKNDECKFFISKSHSSNKFLLKGITESNTIFPIVRADDEASIRIWADLHDIDLTN